MQGSNYNTQYDSRLRNLITHSLNRHNELLFAKLKKIAYDYNYQIVTHKDIFKLVQQVCEKFYIRNDANRSSSLFSLFEALKKKSSNYSILFTLLSIMKIDSSEYVPEFVSNHIEDLSLIEERNERDNQSNEITFIDDILSEEEDIFESKIDEDSIRKKKSFHIQSSPPKILISDLVFTTLESKGFALDKESASPQKNGIKGISRSSDTETTLDMEENSIIRHILHCFVNNHPITIPINDTIFSDLIVEFSLFTDYKLAVMTFIKNSNNNSPVFQGVSVSLLNQILLLDSFISNLAPSSIFQLLLQTRRYIDGLKMLYSIVLRIENNVCHCSLLTSLYQLYYEYSILQHKNSMIIQQVFFDTLLIYIAQINSLLNNDLKDFICVREDVSDDLFWTTSFRLKTHESKYCRPQFMSEAFCHGLLSFLKHLSIYKRSLYTRLEFPTNFPTNKLIDVFINSLSSINPKLISKSSNSLFSIFSRYLFAFPIDFIYLPFDVLFNSCLEKPLISSFSQINLKICNILLQDTEFQYYLKAINHIQFFTIFYDFIMSFFLLLTNTNSISMSLLNSILQDILVLRLKIRNPKFCVLTTSNQPSNSSFAHSKVFSTQKIIDPSVTTFLKEIYFTYNIDFPLSILISSRQIEQYKQISGLLFQVNWAKYILRENFKFKNNSPRFYFIKMKLAHFVNCFEKYISTNVIGIEFNIFQERLPLVTSIDELIEIHDQYLNKIMRKAFLSQISCNAMEKIKNILELCTFFYNSNQNDLISIEEVFNQEIKDILIIFDALLKKEQHSHLDDLILKINYNHFYIQ